eukprot:5136824-Pleurochrysis_carterae.AAC.1
MARIEKRYALALEALTTAAAVLICTIVSAAPGVDQQRLLLLNLVSRALKEARTTAAQDGADHAEDAGDGDEERQREDQDGQLQICDAEDIADTVRGRVLIGQFFVVDLTPPLVKHALLP